MRPAFLAVLALGLAALPAAAQTGLQPRLDAAIDAALAQSRIVGAVVLVARDGQLVYRRAAGLADREAGTPMREDSIFRLSSMTKPITSAAALALVEQGRLSLDAPVTRYLPAFHPALADGRQPDITPRQLMTHTAGLSYAFTQADRGPYRRAGVSDGLDQPGLALEENLRRIAAVSLSYMPGQGWAYSVATDVLGAAMQVAGGAPLPALVQRLVTGPLGMADTGFGVADPARLAAPYVDAAPRPARMAEEEKLRLGHGHIAFSLRRAFDPLAFPSGGAGMQGSAPDFLRFLETLRQGGAPILKPESVALLTQHAEGLVPADSPTAGWGFSLGFSILLDPKAAATPQSPGTWQWGGVYGHSWFVDPAQRLVVVAMTNTTIEGMAGDFPRAVRDAVYEGLR
ncbi:serine hydrolase [Roseomonas sp. 18066]|uniref:serine hydrolase domain-containing protein n=1 Tax=Roseomonas sp. 18066 TaxID=2681412 RepID=UPI001357739B|nr:serine hydrolase domain-containing protein [Roseomonas sp. 18066]